MSLAIFTTFMEHRQGKYIATSEFPSQTAKLQLVGLVAFCWHWWKSLNPFVTSMADKFADGSSAYISW